MASIQLFRYEVEHEGLPAACMRCGAPATIAKNKTFRWHPSWIDTLIVVGLLCFTPLFIAGVVMAFAMSKSMRVAVPLCEAHKNHWLWRTWYILGGFAFFLFAGILAFVLVTGLSDENREMRGIAGLACVGTAGAGLIWLISAAIIQNGAIRASEITESRITLIRVSPKFVDAVRPEDGDQDRWREIVRASHDPDARPRRRAPDEFYDPNAPRHRPPEEFREGRE